MKRFEQEYIRGGRQTLCLTRQDVVETMALILRKGFDFRKLQAEAHQYNDELRYEAHMEKSLGA